MQNGHVFLFPRDSNPSCSTQASMCGAAILRELSKLTARTLGFRIRLPGTTIGNWSKNRADACVHPVSGALTGNHPRSLVGRLIGLALPSGLLQTSMPHRKFRTSSRRASPSNQSDPQASTDSERARFSTVPLYRALVGLPDTKGQCFSSYPGHLGRIHQQLS